VFASLDFIQRPVGFGRLSYHGNNLQMLKIVIAQDLTGKWNNASV
jgi:hypothetical protein